MNYTALFVIMAIVFLVAICIIYSDILVIREKIETIHQLDMELIQTLRDSQRTMDQGWKDALNGWNKTLIKWQDTIDLTDDILEQLKRVTERRE